MHFSRYISERTNKQMSDKNEIIKNRIEDFMLYIIYLSEKLEDRNLEEETIKREIVEAATVAKNLLKYLK